MEILQTKRQLERFKFPTKLDVLRELKKRNALTEIFSNELIRLEAGYHGEQTVLSYLSESGCDHWKVVPNLWLDYYGRFECDLLLITKAGIYPLEIKNYSGKFEFRNSQCLVNGKKVGHNAITQAQKVTINIEQMFQNLSHPFNVQGALIFIGQHNEVTISDRLENIHVIMANQLRNFIWQLAKDEKNYYGPPVDKHTILMGLENYETDNPFSDEDIPNEIKHQVRKGILCSYCGSFDVDTSKSYISCKCGMQEPLENAIVRTICEYGVIHHDKDLTTTELFDFFNSDISRVTVHKYLKKHFRQIGNLKSTRFISQRLPFVSIYNNFRLPKSRKLEIAGY